MVKYLCLILLFLASANLFSEDVKVTAEVESGGPVGAKLKGTITITHNEDQKVDLNSFRLEKEPLETAFLKRVRIAPDAPLIISIYNFTIEAKVKGLQLLPAVSVKVAGKVYSSIPSSYEVKETKEIGVVKEGGQEAVLKLENIVIGDKTLYPGQRIEVGYRYIFNYSIDLTEENVPLLDAAGFRKVGGKKSKNYAQNNLNVVEITQKIEAIDTGDFSFGPSKVTGRAYVQDGFGQKQYAKKVSSSETEEVTLKVLPLPGVGKPTSFNGAIGENFSFATGLIGPDKVGVGDKITLLITIQGVGEIENLPMPEVCCQPGFSGFFLVSDLPPDVEIVENAKKFKVDLRPLSASIDKIPELKFSYFNPKVESYITLKSAPINLNVYERKEKDQVQDIAPERKAEDMERVLEPKPVEIEGNYVLVADDLENILFGSYWVLVIIPFGVLALFIQIQLRNYLREKKREEEGENSRDLFYKALKEPTTSPDFFRNLRKSFLARLVEIGEIEDINTPTDILRTSGASGKVRKILQEMEELRFSGKDLSIDSSFIEKANNIFKEL